MTVELTGVVVDATKPAGTLSQKLPTRQNISLPRGETLEIRLSVVGQDGAAYSLAEATSIKLGVRQFLDDLEPLVTATAEITAEDEEDEDTVGKATITVSADDTVDLDEYSAYAFDVQLEVSSTRRQIIPYSLLKIVPIVNRADE